MITKEKKLIQFEGVNNFRDFGGFRTQNGLFVKKSMLYRSGSLTKASANDLKMFLTLGIKVVCDLRTHKERIKEPYCIPSYLNIKFVHIPIKSKKHNDSGFVLKMFSLIFGKGRSINYDDLLKEIYREYVINFIPEFSKVIKLITNSSDLPILICCRGGKDRTGFICALIQLILGMPFELTIQDYLLSNDYLREFKYQTLNKYKFLSLFGISVKKFLPILEARREYLEAAFSQIKKDYGTVENYIKKGLDFSNKDKLRLNNVLLEKPS